MALPESVTSGLGNTAANAASTAAGTAASVGQQAINIFTDPSILVIAAILIIATILILFFLKQIIVNSILGVVAWLILHYIFNVQLNLFISFIVSLVFGLAGIGVLLILKFLGVNV